MSRPHRRLHEHMQAVEQALLGEFLYGNWGWPHSRSPAHFTPKGLVPKEWQRHCGAPRCQARPSRPCNFRHMHVSIHKAGKVDSCQFESVQVLSSKMSFHLQSSASQCCRSS